MKSKNKSKRRHNRISFCEWNSASNGHYNVGGLICGKCNFSRTLNPKEDKGIYSLNNKLYRYNKCPVCGSCDWYWLPPIARVPRKKSSIRKWKLFWKKLKRRDFNHGATCR